VCVGRLAAVRGAASGEVIDNKADVTPSQMEVDALNETMLQRARPV